MKLSSLASLVLSATVAFAAPTPTINEGSPTIEKRQACNPSGISSSDRSRVVSAFTSSGVVPTLIPSINPKVKVNVNYPAKAVNLGNTFTTARKHTIDYRLVSFHL